MLRPLFATSLLAVGLAGTSEPAEAQISTARAVPLPTAVESSVALVPFGPGEQARYQVKLGAISVGNAVMQIPRLEHVRGRRSYYLSLTLQGGLLFARVNDRYESWMDVETLASHRFIQDVDEVGYERRRHWEIYPDEKRWEQIGRTQTTVDSFTTARPLDDLSFIYFVRTLPLEVGDTYTFPDYFRENRNPVTVRVLRKERVEVPAGTFNTIVVQPIIPNAGGLFGDGGQAEVYFSDDARRTLVKLSTKGIPLLGDLHLNLQSVSHGAPLRRN